MILYSMLLCMFLTHVVVITLFRRKDLDGQSLISETIKDMEGDVDFKRTLNDLKVMGKKKMTLDERKNRRRALDNLSMPSFEDFVAQQQVRQGEGQCGAGP